MHDISIENTNCVIRKNMNNHMLPTKHRRSQPPSHEHILRGPINIITDDALDQCRFLDKPVSVQVKAVAESVRGMPITAHLFHDRPPRLEKTC